LLYFESSKKILFKVFPNCFRKLIWLTESKEQK
jgi:hypothetical protein